MTAPETGPRALAWAYLQQALVHLRDAAHADDEHAPALYTDADRHLQVSQAYAAVANVDHLRSIWTALDLLSEMYRATGDVVAELQVQTRLLQRLPEGGES